VLLVAAHPDDETLFAAAQFSACRTLCIIHTTDGATSRRAAYAAARRSELATSLAAGDCAFVAAEVALHGKLDVLHA
jgi:LmbE family N-acetylglucosaminyl deacetylase